MGRRHYRVGCPRPQVIVTDETAQASRRLNLAPGRLNERVAEQISENGVEDLLLAMRDTPRHLREQFVIQTDREEGTREPGGGVLESAGAGCNRAPGTAQVG